jgi:sulfofructose kinase
VTARVCLVGIGVLDQVWELASLPGGAGKVTALAQRTTGGGMAATAAVAVAALGGRASWIGRVADDDAGVTILSLLADRGVDVSAVEPVPGARSPTSGVLVDGTGERFLAVFPGSGLPEAAGFDEGWLDGAGAVLGDPRWPEGTARLFRLAAARGLPRVLDAETNARDVVPRLAALADHVVFSRRGLADHAGMEDPAAGLAIAAAGLQHATIGVTLGDMGSLWWSGGRAVPLPAPRVAARDTTGCGDTFHGAYALALAEGATVPAAARFATATAALKAERGGGWGGMPGRAEVDALVRAGWG